MERYIWPNWHVILIHYPLGLLSLGLLIEIFTLLCRASTLRTAGRWMILLGTLSLLPIATSGIFALRDIAAQQQPGNDTPWVQIKQTSGFSDAQWQMARLHIIYNAIATGVSLLALIMWIGASDNWRRRLYAPALVMMLAAYGLMTAGAWHGGEMVFHYAMGVNREARVPVVKIGHEPIGQVADQVLDPMQLHLLMAGLVFAIAAGALAMTIRASVQARAYVVEHKPTDEAAADLLTLKSFTDAHAQTVSVQPMPGDPEISQVISTVLPPVPSARFWVLAAIAGVLTILGGFWVGDYFKDPGQFAAHVVRRLHFLLSSDGIDKRRQGMHIIFGTCILLLTLVLAILARWKPRGRVILATFSSLLILVMATQVWLGVLMLYDSGNGSLTGFQKEPPVLPSPPPPTRPTTMGSVI